jgi:hypothetical protein
MGAVAAARDRPRGKRYRWLLRQRSISCSSASAT